MADIVEEPVVSLEAQKFEAWANRSCCLYTTSNGTQKSWLTLGAQGLGCAVCARLPGDQIQNRERGGFVSGSYKIRIGPRGAHYVYARTFTDHTQSKVHRRALTYQANEMEVAEVAAPEGGALGVAASLGETEVAAPAAPPSAAPPTPSCATPPDTPRLRRVASSQSMSARSSEPETFPKVPANMRRRTHNTFLSVYSTLHNGWSSAVFEEQISMARLQGADVDAGHDSSSFFREAAGFVVAEVQRGVKAMMHRSPVFGISLDEKDRFLDVIGTFLDVADGHKPRSVVLGYRELAGFEAADIFAGLRAVCEEVGLDLKKRLTSFTADGASVMGVRRALSQGGTNVARMLFNWVQRNFLVVHCSAHRLQLSVSASFGKDHYLADLERRVNALFRALRGRGGGDQSVVDLIFWSMVTGEEMIASLGTAKARWLSLLAPLEKLHKSYLTLMCHLTFEFAREKDKEKRKTIQWVFELFRTWEFRFTVAGLVDILRFCFEAKNKLEKQRSSAQVHRHIETLKTDLGYYCGKQSRVAQLLEQIFTGGGLPAEFDPLLSVERMLEAYSQNRGKPLAMRYWRDGALIEETVPLTDVGGAEKVKAMFARLKRFAEACVQDLSDRFPHRGVAEELAIFDEGWVFTQDKLSKAARALAEFFGLHEADLRAQLQRAWCVREVIVQRDATLPERPFELWPKVLSEVGEGDCARFVVGAFLVQHSESAGCERVFAVVEHLKRHLGDQKDGQLFEQYLWVMANAPPTQEVHAQGLLARAVEGYLAAKERRAGHDVGTYYRKGNRMCKRWRARRSDAGAIGVRKYSMVKRHSRLRGLERLRTLQRRVSDPETAPASAALRSEAVGVPAAITVPMSPRRLRRCDTDISVASEIL